MLVSGFCSVSLRPLGGRVESDIGLQKDALVFELESVCLWFVCLCMSLCVRDGAWTEMESSLACVRVCVHFIHVTDYLIMQKVCSSQTGL